MLTARGGELEGEFAFGIVRQLFEAPLAAASAGPARRAAPGAAALSESLFASRPRARREETESSFAMLHGLYWLAANFASPRRRCSSSTTCTGRTSRRCAGFIYLARRLEGLPLLLLAATRPPDQANSLRLSGSCSPIPAAVAIRPGRSRPGLRGGARTRTARDRAGGGVRCRARDGLGRQPALPGRAARRGAQQGLAPTVENAPHVLELGPRAVSYGVSTRLARLRQKRPICSCSGDPRRSHRHRLAAALAGIDPTTALTAASALVRADLLRNENPLEFTHPVVRQRFSRT